MQKRVAVIGGGIAGLSCAWDLQKAGWTVEVYERNTAPGGRMSTRTKEGLAFDLGANFLVRAYDQVFRLAQELAVGLHCVSPVDHAVYRDGRPRLLHFSSLQGMFRMDCLGWWSRVQVLRFLLQVRLQYPLLDFFHLSTLAPGLNKEDAYNFARRHVGQEFADYIVDSFNACMMFHPASEISSAAFLSLFRMMADPAYDFGIYHAVGDMQAIPQALARVLTVHCNCPVLELASQGSTWQVYSPRGTHVYDRVVLATTAGAALQLLPPGTTPLRHLLESTRYSSTINVSYRIPTAALAQTHCFYVPSLENPLISEFTNESVKGLHTTREGWSLVNVGLHETGALPLLEQSDEQIFTAVQRQFLILNSHLTAAQVLPYDLQRWTEAIPKYDCQHIDRVRCFEEHGQGSEGLYLCGDYLNAPWLEGACRSGKRAAQAILAHVET